MDAGKLRHRVTIECEGKTPNGQGGFTTAWAPVASGVPAEIIGLSGSEAISSGVERSVTLYRVSIRSRSDVSAKVRLKWNGRVLAVKSVIPHPQHPVTAMQILCEMSGAA